MSQPVPSRPNASKADIEHLRLLSIFHFVAAGLAAIGLLFLFGHYMMFRMMMDHPRMAQLQGPDPDLMMGMMWLVYGLMGIWSVASIVLNLAAGVYLRARKHRTFTMFVAGVNCLNIPLGTVLGVFTILVLMRDSVRELYETQSHAEDVYRI